MAALAIAIAALVGCAPMAAAPAAPAATISESAWVACVDAAYAAGDPTDATLQACDARHGGMWHMPSEGA